MLSFLRGRYWPVMDELSGVKGLRNIDRLN